MSTVIGFKNIVKKFDDQVIIPGLSLKVNEGEFFTLLGPSGCGKTTLLRMVAGFNSIEGGEISFNESVINQRPANKRNVGMVFQNYAIFPHMTVEQNVAYGLKLRKLSKEEIQKKTDEILKVVQIDAYRDRYPDKLSGGQQQRVALARAIVIRPDVLLMDEPLSNLDAKLRVDMRVAIRDIQHNVGITTIYVTHDQEEALAISDRIAVMNGGVIQQVDTPMQMYLRPANTFVATFVGHSNLFSGVAKSHNGRMCVCIGNNYILPVNDLSEDVSEGQPVTVSVRPEEFSFSSDDIGINGTVISRTFLGNYTDYRVKTESGEVVELNGDVESGEKYQDGSKVRLKANSARVNVFSDDGTRSLMKGVSNYEG